MKKTLQFATFFTGHCIYEQICSFQFKCVEQGKRNHNRNTEDIYKGKIYKITESCKRYWYLALMPLSYLKVIKTP